MTITELAHGEQVLISSLRGVTIHGHGRLIVEVRDGKVQMIEVTEKIKIS